MLAINGNQKHLNHSRYCKLYSFLKKVISRVFPPCTRSPYWATTTSYLRFRNHTQTHYTRQDSRGRVISPTKRPQLTKTSLTRDTHPCSLQDSNPHSLQANGLRPILQAARKLGSACHICIFSVIVISMALSRFVLEKSGKTYGLSMGTMAGGGDCSALSFLEFQWKAHCCRLGFRSAV